MGVALGGVSLLPTSRVSPSSPDLPERCPRASAEAGAPMSSPVVATQTLRPVTLSAVSLFCPAGIGPDGARGGAAGPVPGFQPVKWIPDRKGLKLMSRAVQLGVAAVRQAIALDGTLEQLPPLRRALFVGASPQTGDPEDLRPALDKALGPDGFDLDKFAREGIDLVGPRGGQPGRKGEHDVGEQARSRAVQDARLQP